MKAKQIWLKRVSGSELIELGEETVLGRSPECDILLSEGHPSRRHARILVNEEGAFVQDLGSTNGTFLNGKQVVEVAALAPGDLLRFDLEGYEVVELAPEEMGMTVMRESAVADPVVNEVSTAVSSAPQIERRPGSWADPDARTDAGTRLLDADEIEKLRAMAPVATSTHEVETPFLRVASGSRSGTNLKLMGVQHSNQWEVGSESDRDIVLTDPGVSGFHAKVVNEENRWKVIDQMSANGVFVNDQKTNISYIKSGDRIRFGPVECVFQLPETGDRPAELPDSTQSKSRPAVLVGASFLIVLVAFWGALIWFGLI